MPSHRRGQPGLTPHKRARIAELRVRVPWLGLRRIARALDLSLHEVRQALVDRLPPQRLTGQNQPPRCKQCGAKLLKQPCLACATRAAIEPPSRP